MEELKKDSGLMADIDIKLTVKDSGTKAQRAVVQGLKKQNNAFLEVGIFEEAITQNDEQIANYANNNEFGIGVPERSFMRTAFDENVRKFEGRAVKQERLIIDGKKSPLGALSSLGFDIEREIVKKIKSNIQPTNASETTTQKGSSKTLIDTGAMLRAVVGKVTIGGQKRKVIGKTNRD